MLPELKVWQTLVLGGQHQNYQAYRNAMEASRCAVSPYAENDILRKMRIRQTRTEIDPVKVRVADLDCKLFAYWRDIFTSISRLGLRPCPIEVGPSLCLALSNQCSEGTLWIGIDSVQQGPEALGIEIPEVPRHQEVLHITCDHGNRRLGGGHAKEHDIWYPANEWIFKLPRR